MKRSRFGQPEWASEEESKLGQEWVDSNSSLSITDYIYSHASDRLKEEYQRQDEIYADMRFGTGIDSDGNVIIYN